MRGEGRPGELRIRVGTHAIGEHVHRSTTGARSDVAGLTTKANSDILAARSPGKCASADRYPSRNPMKITNVTAYHLPGTRYAWVFLRIDTDAGVHGLGQVSSGPNSAIVAAAASRLGPLLIGEDPSRIEYLWQKLYAGFNSLGSLGFVSALISGVDIALWDIRGKALGLPIYDLLGGRFHDRLVLYSNGWFSGCSTPEEFAAAAAKTVAEGHTAIKLDPFTRGHRYLSRYAASYPPEDALEAVAIVERIREAVGPGVEIFIDAHGRFDVPTAVRLANQLAPYRIGWFEEQVPPENWDALRQFR